MFNYFILAIDYFRLIKKCNKFGHFPSFLISIRFFQGWKKVPKSSNCLLVCNRYFARSLMLCHCRMVQIHYTTENEWLHNLMFYIINTPSVGYGIATMWYNPATIALHEYEDTKRVIRIRISKKNRIPQKTEGWTIYKSPGRRNLFYDCSKSTSSY